MPEGEMFRNDPFIGQPVRKLSTELAKPYAKASTLWQKHSANFRKTYGIPDAIKNLYTKTGYDLYIATNFQLAYIKYIYIPLLKAAGLNYSAGMPKAAKYSNEPVPITTWVDVPISLGQGFGMTNDEKAHWLGKANIFGKQLIK